MNAFMKNTVFFSALLSGLCWATAADAGLYKWTDAQGQVHFSQIPPSNGKFETLKGAKKGSAPAAPVAKAAPVASTAGTPQLVATPPPAPSAADKKKACDEATKDIAYLDEKTPRRLFMKDKDGNESRVTEEQFNAMRAESVKKASDNCKK
jgi:hypothetical protein